MVYYLNFLNKCISNIFDLIKKNLLKKKKYIKMFYTFIKCLTIIHPIFIVVFAMLSPTSR